MKKLKLTYDTIVSSWKKEKTRKDVFSFDNGSLVFVLKDIDINLFTDKEREIVKTCIKKISYNKIDKIIKINKSNRIYLPLYKKLNLRFIDEKYSDF